MFYDVLLYYLYKYKKGLDYGKKIIDFIDFIDFTNVFVC